MSKPNQAQLSPEERHQRSVSAKRKFRAIVRLIIANLTWLQEIDDYKLGDNVKKNIQVLTRKKGKKSVLTLGDKAVLNKQQDQRTDAEKSHLKRLIGNLKCFRMYPPEVKKQLAGVMYFCYYGPNRVIVKQGYKPLNMYVLLAGEVVVSRRYYDSLLKEDVTKDVMVMGAGNFFGEVSLLHGINRTATVTTTQDCEFLYIKREDFDRVLKQTVAQQWAEIQTNMSNFTYFKDWSEIDIRECCIYAKQTSFEANQIILSSMSGQMDCVYFVTKGSCYLLEYMTIKTTTDKKLQHYSLVEDNDSAKVNTALTRGLKKLYSNEESATTLLKSSLRPAVSPASSLLMPSYVPPPVQSHFFKVCTFGRLACFNVGENLKNRLIISETNCECLLLPRYFLMEKSSITFQAIEQFLTNHIPSSRKIFQNFLQEKKWNTYKEHLVENIMSGKRTVSNNTIHNVPYTIRLAEDLGDA